MNVNRDPERSVGFLISDVSRLLRRNFNRRVQALGLTQTQWRAIAHLSRNEGINQAALAEALDVQPISLARLIDRMEAAAWVERRSDPQDRRATRLFLTSKSQPILDEMWELAAQTIEDALNGLSADERRQVVAGLRRIKQNLTAAEDAAKTGKG